MCITHHILTVFFCFFCRVILAVTGIFLFVVLSTSVGFLPNAK